MLKAATIAAQGVVFLGVLALCYALLLALPSEGVDCTWAHSESAVADCVESADAACVDLRWRAC